MRWQQCSALEPWTLSWQQRLALEVGYEALVQAGIVNDVIDDDDDYRLGAERRRVGGLPEGVNPGDNCVLSEGAGCGVPARIWATLNRNKQI